MASDDWARWSNHVLSEIKRLDSGVADSNATLKDQKEILGTINQTLIRNTVSLEAHVKRTNLLEAKLEHMESAVNTLKEAKWMTSGAIKFMILITSIATCVGTLITILDKFK